MTSALHYLELTELSRRIHAREISPVEATTAQLARIEKLNGTGKCQGISGDNTFVGVTQVNWKDGTSSGYATWNR
jgi:Asp-tRNA(Asn)/Glu-tRNA(Gln) amidotransferase A subunit family amidase